MITITALGEAMDMIMITTVETALDRFIDLSFELFEQSDEFDRLENIFLSLAEHLQFDRNRSHRDVSGHSRSFDWSFSTANKLSPTVDLLSGMGRYDRKLVIIRSRYGMRENGVSCVIIKKLVVIFPYSKHRAFSFSTGAVGVGGIGKTNLAPHQEKKILVRGGWIFYAFTRMSLWMEFVMYICLFAGALLHLLPQRTISGGEGQVSVLFQGLPVPAALQSLFVINIALVLSAAYGALLVGGSNSGTLKAFYTYVAVIFVAAAGGILAYGFTCLLLS